MKKCYICREKVYDYYVEIILECEFYKNNEKIKVTGNRVEMTACKFCLEKLKDNNENTDIIPNI